MLTIYKQDSKINEANDIKNGNYRVSHYWQFALYTATKSGIYILNGYPFKINMGTQATVYHILTPLVIILKMQFLYSMQYT